MTTFDDFDFALHTALSASIRTINPEASVEQEGNYFHVIAPVASCDFCTGRPVTHTIKATDFEMPSPDTLHHMSRGHWAACTRCSVLVIAKEWQALEDLVVGQLGEPCRRYIHQLYRSLRDHMTGEVVPV